MPQGAHKSIMALGFTSQRRCGRNGEGGALRRNHDDPRYPAVDALEVEQGTC